MMIYPLHRSKQGVAKAVLIMGVAVVFSMSAGITRPALGATVDKIKTIPKVYSLNICEKRQFKATVKGKDGKTIKNAKVIWRSTNPSVAKIDRDGVAVGVSPGYTFIQPRVGDVKGTAASLFIRNKGVTPTC